MEDRDDTEVAPVRGDEARVVAQFSAWLQDTGWQVSTEVDFCDVVATRGGQILYAEAKGRTTSPGLDVDTMYGQLLRRMLSQVGEDVRYAVVVPQAARTHVLRVSEEVRARLGIDVYVVSDEGGVEAITSPHV